MSGRNTTGNFAAALGNIQRSLAADRDPPWTRLLALVNVLRDSGDARGAEAVARRLVLREPARVQAQNALGLALHDQARFDEAIAVFRQAATMEPAYVGAQLNLALALEAKGDLSDAIAAVQAALERIPNSAALALAFATLLDHAKRRDEASEWYLRAARMDPIEALRQQ